MGIQRRSFIIRQLWNGLIILICGMAISLAIVVPRLRAALDKNVDLPKDIQEGDIIFQVSRSPQSRAIQEATGSIYSHVGIIFIENDAPQVLEAVEPVRMTPLGTWIKRGENGQFVLKRLKDRSKQLTGQKLIGMRKAGFGFLKKNYDLAFGWSDEKIYCSELVWKVYERGAGIKLSKLKQLKDFDLSKPVVRIKLKERYGNEIPYDENVVSPSDIFESRQLITVIAQE